MNKKANNLIESENGKLMSPEELFMYNEEQNLQSEIDDLEEGKLFALNTLRQEEKTESEKLNYVLDKLSVAGIEVITNKNIFEELLNISKIVQKVEKDNISEKYFRANEAEVEAFSRELDSFIGDYEKSEKSINPLKLLDVGSISPVMKILGIADVPVGIDQSTITKALREEPIFPNDKQGHKLTIEELKSIPQSLADPVMVFRSDSPTRRHKDSYVFFTEHKDSKNRTVIIPIAVNKKYGRLVINKVTSIYGRNEEVRYVKDNIQRGNLVYFDKKRSLEWERECKVQFLAQVLPNKGSVNNILSKETLVKFLNSKTQNMVQKNTTYGFIYDGKIYLNSDIMNSEVAVHEYTHLWDNYTQKTNPELWQKGKDIFKGTSYWYEVKSDPNYADIKNNDDLVLSEIHSRICGKMADAVLTKIAEKDGVITKDKAIDWDKEVFRYILTEFQAGRERDNFDFRMDEEKGFTENLFDFLAQPMKDLMQGKIITNNIDNNVIQKYTSDISKEKDMNKITISDIRFLKSAGLDTDKKSLETFAFIKEYFLLNTKNLPSEEKNLYAMIALEGFNNPNSKNFSKLGEFLCGKKPENLKTRLLTLGYLKELNKKDNLNNTENIERLKLIKEKLMNQQNGFYSLLQNNGISKEYKAAIIERALKYELAQPQKQAILNMAYENAKSYVTEKTNSNTYSFKRR